LLSIDLICIFVNASRDVIKKFKQKPLISNSPTCENQGFFYLCVTFLVYLTEWGHLGKL